jgi:lipopolysaccharide export system protein LptA
VPGFNPAPSPLPPRAGWLPLLWLLTWLSPIMVCAQSDSSDSTRDPLTISADFSRNWLEGDTRVHLLHGHCVIQQGETRYRADRAVVWTRPDQRDEVTVYLEENVKIERPGSTASRHRLLLTLPSETGLLLHAKRPANDTPAPDDPLYARALEERGGIRRVPARAVRQRETPEGIVPPGPDGEDLLPPGPEEPIPEFRAVQLPAPQGPSRRFSIFSRTGGNWNFETFPSPDSTPPEQVLVFSGGVNLVVEGLGQTVGGQKVDTLDLSADRIVVWTDPVSSRNFSGSADQSADLPLQVYLEGNIVIRQGGNVLRAAQAFYDVREQRALLYNAELKTQIEGFPAKVRVLASQLRQLAPNTYQASNAAITTSDFARPGYAARAGEIYIEPRNVGWYGDNPVRFNPATGQYEADETLWATAVDTTFEVEGLPVFYAPQISAPAEDPNIPLRNVSTQYDGIFGFQLYTVWDAFKLFGLDRPPGYRWDIDIDYLSERGPMLGTDFTYRGTERWGEPGAYRGELWGTTIYDTGRDNLGRDRLSLEPKEEWRGGLSLRDRWDLPYDMTLLSSFAFLSDRNFLEQYRERDYDTGDDYETQLFLRQTQHNWSWSAWLRPQLYNYYNNTQWLPRGDLFVIGEPLFGTPITWTSHSSAGFGIQRIADPSTDPNDYYSVLPWEADAEAGVFMTKHELAAPFWLGPFNIVPYVQGEADYWTDGFGSGPVDRLYGALGVRSSVEFWKVWSDYQNDLFALNGLSHKMTFDADWSYAESTTSINDIVQFNEFDDNSQEQFRRRLYRNTFNYNIPPQFNARNFAIRSGAANSVTAPYHELVDDMHAVRLGWRHRLQTKSGPPNAPRIRDWMSLDLETSVFPDADRDNYGEPLGLWTARYNWFISDRTTITAGTLFDTFDNPETLYNIGIMSQRSARGSVYLGYRAIQGGPLDSQIVTASYSYLMSQKWISTLSAAWDIAEGESRGQSLTISRIGADFLVHLGLSIDPTKDNYGVGLSIEPRFAPFVGKYGAAGNGTQLGSLVPPYSR